MAISRIAISFFLLSRVCSHPNECQGKDPRSDTYTFRNNELNISCQADVSWCAWNQNTCYYRAANFTIEGIIGPFGESNHCSGDPQGSTEIAKQDAINQFFASYSDNILCNCYYNSTTVEGCDVDITICFNGADVVHKSMLSPEVQMSSATVTGLLYHGWASWHDNFRDALVYLQDHNPECFSASPTPDPTFNPTAYPTDPTTYPTLQNCADCLRANGERCLSGFQSYEANHDYCEPCPDGNAGTDGLCYPCPSGEKPAFDRRFCEDKAIIKIGWGVIGGILSGVGTVIGTGILAWCNRKWIKHVCCPDKKLKYNLVSVNNDEQL